MIFLFQGSILRFHVNLPGCIHHYPHLSLPNSCVVFPRVRGTLNFCAASLLWSSGASSLKSCSQSSLEEISRMAMATSNGSPMSWAFCNLYTVYIHMFHITISSKYLGTKVLLISSTNSFFGGFALGPAISINGSPCRVASSPWRPTAVPAWDFNGKSGIFWDFCVRHVSGLTSLTDWTWCFNASPLSCAPKSKWINALTQDIPIKVGTAQTHRRRKKTFLNKNINSPSNLCVFSCFFF